LVAARAYTSGFQICEEKAIESVKDAEDMIREGVDYLVDIAKEHQNITPKKVRVSE